MNGSRRELRRAPPVVRQREREPEAQRRVRGLAARAVGQVGGVRQQLEERDQHDRRQRRPRRDRRRGTSRRRRGPRSSANSNAAASTWKLVSGCPPEYCRATTSASPAKAGALGLRTTRSVSSSTHGSHAHTLDSGQASQTTWKSPNPATTPASSAAPDGLPEPPRQQERPERGHPELQRPDQPQRPPERQHVGRPRERREDRRLHVRVERPPALDVRVPERDVRQPLARVGQERLELRDRVGHLPVRAEVAHAVGAVRGPRRDRPQHVGRGQRPAGDERGCDEQQRKHRVEQRGGERRPPAKRGGG